MDNIVVHNISDRDIVDVLPQAFTVGGIVIRPGKFATIPLESVTQKVKDLHGKCIWIGKLPQSLVKKKVAPVLQVSSMTQEEAGLYLQGLNITELKNLNEHLVPSFTFAERTTKRKYVLRIKAACFSPDVILDPEEFFWLGRWKKLSNGDYQEI